MSGIGIRTLVNRGTEYANNFIDQFVTSSVNIKKSIKQYKINYNTDNATNNNINNNLNNDSRERRNMMIALIRDTFVCNLLLGYTGMMRLITDDPIFEEMDTKLLKYINDFYDDTEFTKSLCMIYTKYKEQCDGIELGDHINYENMEFIRFLERIIDRLQIVDKKVAIQSYITMLENKIYNLINVTPLIVLDSKYTKSIPLEKLNKLEITGKKITKNNSEILEIPLHYDNYSILINNVTSLDIRHEIEKKYVSRSHTAMKDFSDLVIYRKLFASEMGYPSFFQYVTRDKKDNSEVIKKLIISLNSKIENQTKVEIEKIYNYYNKRFDIANHKKITHVDIRHYIKIHSNSRTYDKYVVIYYLFLLIKKYFGITVKRYDWQDKNNDKNNDKNKNNTENGISFDTFKSFELVLDDDKPDNGNLENNLLGRLYIDIDRSDTKKIIDPISVKVSDRMLISDNLYSVPEVVLLANYDKEITYLDIVQLFKEFGYVLQELCYKSGVGLVNRDPEFSNFMPILMENIAWDRDTIELICGKENSDIVDHTFAMRYFNICIALKHKCINAKFDHLLHNSDEMIEILVKIINNNEDVSDSVKNTIVQLYQTIYKESFGNVSDYLNIPEDITLASVDPLNLVQEINGAQGLLYSNLMNEIFAYSTYHILKNKLKSGNEFRKIVLENGVTPFKDLISEFLSVPNLNSFNLYLTKLLGIVNHGSNDLNKSNKANRNDGIQSDQIDYGLTDNNINSNINSNINTEYDSSYNNFDDKVHPDSDAETEMDKGSIIRINRV